jgi:hypothetical protein
MDAERSTEMTRKRTARTEQPQGISELRLRIGGVEIRVTGESREDCLRQLDAAAEEVDREALAAEAAWTLTAAGRRVLGEVA